MFKNKKNAKLRFTYANNCSQKSVSSVQLDFYIQLLRIATLYIRLLGNLFLESVCIINGTMQYIEQTAIQTICLQN